MTLPDWADLDTDAKRAIIRPLWAEGKSAGEITAYFVGATRNMVIGQINRGKMSGGRQPGSTVRPKAPGASKRMRDPANLDRPRPIKRTTPKTATSAFVTIANPDPPSSSVMALIDRDRPPLPGIEPITLVQLENGLCRFPVIGGYCGHETETMYCEAHARYMYNSDALAHRRGSDGRLGK